MKSQNIKTWNAKCFIRQTVGSQRFYEKLIGNHKTFLCIKCWNIIVSDYPSVFQPSTIFFHCHILYSVHIFTVPVYRSVNVACFESLLLRTAVIVSSALHCSPLTCGCALCIRPIYCIFLMCGLGPCCICTRNISLFVTTSPVSIFLYSMFTLWAGIAQSAQRIGTCWMVRGSNPGGVENFGSRPDRAWGPLSLLYNRCRVFPGGKAAGALRWPPTPT